MLTLAICQRNFTVGDFSGNLAQIRHCMQRAHEQAADIAVFSELALCGYYPGDLLEDAAFLSKLDASLTELLEFSRSLPDLVSVVGTVRANRGPGKPLHNALLAIQNGAIVAEYYKQLLPTYGIFDERRHFEPGPEHACLLRVKQQTVGFIVCEDGWNNAGQDYHVNPFALLQEAQPDLVISINASPSDIGKRAQRHELFTQAARATHLPLLYVNQIGGHDQLVFDGASFAVSPSQGIAFEAERFTEDFQLLGFSEQRFVAVDGTHLPQPEAAGLAVAEFTRRQIVLGLQDYARRCGFKKVVVGCQI
ncbi:MAG: hypothetical protein HYZ45_00660 [Burkholderiales bacterium]|nr:hypothetical protein [Burkholderiales bacterium]